MKSCIAYDHASLFIGMGTRRARKAGTSHTSFNFELVLFHIAIAI